MSWTYFDSAMLSLILLMACAVRSIFYTGMSGSDDLIYTEKALDILSGNWTASSYVGSIRYGINLPVAGFMWLFGTSEYTANLWSYLCSVGEVALAFVFARIVWGLRVATLSALILGLLPLHVRSAGELLADSPLAFFLSVTFVLFFFAERHQKRLLYLSSGLALGLVYWIKTAVAILCCPIFVVYALCVRRLRGEWVWLIAGGMVMLLLNLALFWDITGNPFHAFLIDRGTVHVGSTHEGLITNPSYYLRYLFFDVKHTWLMPWLALFGAFSWYKRKEPSDAGSYILLWALGLIAILSLTPLSLSPFKLIYKQVNYMLIFVFPVALLAGYGVSRLRGALFWVVLAVVSAGSLVLCALEQQAIRCFTANSYAIIRFAQEKKPVPVYGNMQAHDISALLLRLGDDRVGEGQVVRPLAELARRSPPSESDIAGSRADGAVAYVTLDMETLAWRGDSQRITPSSVPECWRFEQILAPTGFGGGRVVLTQIRNAAALLLPAAIGEKVIQVTDQLYHPKPAYVYAIPSGCELLVDGS